MNISHQKKKGFATIADENIGKRIKLRRSLLGMTQSGMAEQLDITFQQLQKYEKGTNRVSAARLYQISKILEVPLEYFYEDYEDHAEKPDPTNSIILGYADDSEAVELLKIYFSIEDPEKRKSILQFVRALTR